MSLTLNSRVLVPHLFLKLSSWCNGVFSTMKMLLDSSYWLPFLLISMATFHAIGKPELTFLVSNYEVIQVTENVFYAMFAFWWRFVHLFKDVSYLEDIIVLSFVYQVLDVNPIGMLWIIIDGRYQIIDKHAFNKFQDIVLTPCTFASVANIDPEGIVMKKKPIVVSRNLKFFILIVESSFIDLYGSFDEDGPFLSWCCCPYLHEFMTCWILASVDGCVTNYFH